MLSRPTYFPLNHVHFHIFAVKKCSTANINPQCPPHSVCADKQADVTEGICKCSVDEQFVFNAAYKDDSDYCRYDASIKLPQDNESKPEPNQPEAALSVDNGIGSAPPTKESEKLKVHPLPGAHHVIGGILIPIFFVLAAVGVIYGVRHLHIRQRMQNIRMSRRNRPFYEDVMLGTNEHDDPPLI